MKVLFVVPYPPSRVRVRSYNLLLGLLGRGHQVTLATLCSDASEWADVAHLESLGASVLPRPLGRTRSLLNCLQALPSAQPLQAAFSWSPGLAARLVREAAGYDVAHVEHLRGARYALALRPHLPVVWDAVDCISFLFEQAAAHSRTLFGRWVTRFELPRTRAFEARMVAAVGRTLVTSAVDRAALLKPRPAAGLAERVAVLSNGVDTDYYQAGDEPAEAGRLVFSGKLSYHANTTAVLQVIEAILPRLWRSHPEARLTIVGQNPPPRLRSAVAGDGRLELAANVPDTRPYLRRAAIALAPMVYGAGIQNKVLEAMSMSRPVIATPTATGALQARPGRDLLEADTPERFAAAIARLLDDGALRAELGRNGRRYVERYHRWPPIAARLEAVYAAARAGG